MDTRIDGLKCLRCHKLIDGATGMHDKTHVPKDGDISICIFCGEAMIFVINVLGTSVRPMDDETWKQIAPEQVKDILSLQERLRDIPDDLQRRIVLDLR